MGIYDNLNDLKLGLHKLDQMIMSASLESDEEGAVVYLVSRNNGKNEKVLSLSKFKTHEYRIIRKMREKIKNFWKKDENKYEHRNYRKSGLGTRYDLQYSKFLKEVKQLIAGVKLPLQ